MNRGRASLVQRHPCAGMAAAFLSVACARHALAQSPAIAPEVLERVDAVAPPETASLTKALAVVLTVLVDEGGTVRDAAIAEGGGPPFDSAALAAVKRWRFRPALMDGKPIASRIRVSFAFHATSPSTADDGPKGPGPEIPSPPTDTPLQPSTSSGTEAAGAPPASEPVSPAPAPSEVVVRGTVAPPSHGASDVEIPIGMLRLVPRGNASEYLKLAPGILLTNEGGEGHAEQVFLRGFDAREGQDVEFSVDGVPVNDSGNVHGNGYADTHFIIPELLLGLRVTEGPFSPEQGNFAVAGSADYHLGLETRGVTAKATYGSFRTERLLLLWGPAHESSATFGGVEAYKTDGYGDNRAATRTSAMAQYEIDFPSGATLRIGGQAYATHFQAAGVIRQDDWQAGRVSFFGTEDPLQGGDAARFSMHATYTRSAESSALQQSLFLVRRDMRLREDFTGFLRDTQNELDTLHNQRGDLIDMNFGAWTLGSRGLGRWSTELGGLKQSVDVGYLARLDLTDSTQYRNTVPGNIPYKLETDLQSTLTDVGLYADASLRPLEWLVLRGGARIDTFSYNVLNGCAAQGDFDNPSKTRPPTNESCHDQVQFGAHREPVQRSSTGALKVMPRATVMVGPFQHFNLSFSYGEGVRSIDPTYISQDLDTPFASVRAYDAGITFAHDFGPVELSARSVLFETKVDRDLVFSQTAGRNVLANGTTRVGWASQLRAAGSFFDDAANLTFVRPTFDDTGLQIPYVPTLVFREDGALFGDLPWPVAQKPVRVSTGVGFTFVGRRALPYNQSSDIISVVDANAAFAWFGWELSLAVTNLFDRRCRLGEFNYASDFHSAPEPTLIPTRHFTAGAPRGVFLSLSSNLGGAS